MIYPVSTTSNQNSTATTATTLPLKQVMGQDDFLKLLSVQFQSQDPMKPMEDTAFIAQMAQFSALQETQTLTQQMTQLRANQDISTANSYLGLQLTVDEGKGTAVTGVVSAVDASGSAPKLIIDGKSYPLSSVLFVEPPVASVPASQPVTTVGG